MRATILLGFSILFFAACQTCPVRWTQSSPEVDAIKSLVKDYEAGNWDSWSAHYADTAKAHHNSVEGISPQQLQEALKADIDRLNSYGFGDHESFYEMIVDDEGDKWVYFWGTWEATVAETNEILVIPVHLAFNLVDNKIVDEWGFYNYAPAAIAYAAQDAARNAAKETEEVVE